MQSYYLEIKYRSLLLGFTWAAVILVSYSFKEVLLHIITYSYKNEMIYFIFTDVTEIFTAFVSLIFFIGNQTLLLYFFYHILLFILPSLTKFESSFLIFIFLTSTFLFFLSLAVFNHFVFSLSWDFFFSFKKFGNLKSFVLHFESKLIEYLIFYIKFYYVCVFYFQGFLFPILFFTFITKELKVYTKFRKVIHFVCFFFSTLVTPPDVLSQVVLSLSFIVNCEILIYCFTFKVKGFVNF